MDVDDLTPATLIVTLNIHGAGTDEYKCGEMNLLSLMTALSVNYMLSSNSFASRNYHFNLRSLVLDNCANSLRIDQDLMSIFLKGELCNEDFDWGGTTIDSSTVIGVYTTSSRFVVAANRVTRPLKIQIISPTSTSTALSNHQQYPYLARTVSPDNIQMAIIAQLLDTNDWSYVGVIYSLESYGINGYRTLDNLLNNGNSSCVGIAEGVDYPASVDEIRPNVQNVIAQDYVYVIVVVSLDPVSVMEAFIEEGVAANYVLILSETWAERAEDVSNLALHFKAVLGMTFHDSSYDSFVDYMMDISYDNKMGIPDDWFDEFYQHLHECYNPNAGRVMMQYDEECIMNLTATREKLLPHMVGKREIMATYAISEGLTDFSRQYACSGDTFALCVAKAMATNTDRDARVDLFDRTLGVTYNNIANQWSPNETFSFELGSNRYWDTGYDIVTFNRIATGGEAVTVGDSNGVDELRFDKAGFNDIQDDNDRLPLSDIKSECPDELDCTCVVFGGVTSPQVTIQPKYLRDHEPRNYFEYDDDGVQTYEWPIWAIAVAVLTCLGLVTGLLLFFYFLVFYPVRGGTTILGFLMMIGMFGIYAINFAFFLPASKATCGAREFVMGVVYAIAIAPLLVKSVDNWRFKDAEYTTKQYRGLTSPFALVTISLGIVLIQCIIPIQWLILRPPSASLMTDSTAQHDWMWCDPHDFYDISLVLSFVFVMFLVLLTAIFAALSWDSESNYFESRWIFSACVATAGCFLVWMVVSTNAGPPYRDPAVAIANFVNATCLLILMPLRKLVLLIKFQGEEEKAKAMPATEGDVDDMYSTVYTNQMYQPDVFQPEDEKPPLENGY